MPGDACDEEAGLLPAAAAALRSLRLTGGTLEKLALIFGKLGSGT